jgi:transketolase
MRSAFSTTLVRLAQADPRIVLLTGDHGYSLFDEFRNYCPQQYINAGIAEQNMVGMAAGLARVGFRPIVYGLSAFVPVRVLEQIKLDIAHDELPVILIGDGAGFVYSHLGTSHQSLEDMAVLRSIPNVSVCSPADRFELQACLETAYSSASCFYIRMGKADRGDIHDSIVDSILSPILVETGIEANGNLIFLATGSMVVTARQLVKENFPTAQLFSVPLVQPLDSSQLVKDCINAKLVVTFEEHCNSGGLGSAVCESLSLASPIRILRIGSENRFSKHCGSYEYLLTEHGLDNTSVASKINSTLKRYSSELVEI